MARSKKAQAKQANGTSSFQKIFGHIANFIARATGRPLAFSLAALTVIVWAVTGPLFGYSDTWQLVINTGTTIVTFLMVFLIQNTQNRDPRRSRSSSTSSSASARSRTCSSASNI